MIVAQELPVDPSNVLAVLGVLLLAAVGGLVYMARQLVNARTQKECSNEAQFGAILDANSKHVAALIASNTAALNSLREAVDVFRKFEQAEHEIHSRLIQTQEQMLSRLEDIEKRLTS